MASYRDMARDLSKKVAMYQGYFHDHLDQMVKLNDQLRDLAQEIEKFGDQVGELEKKQD